MSPKLPVISGADLIKALAGFGYLPVRQKGSHVRLGHTSDPATCARNPFLFARKSPLGQLRRILRDAAISVDELISTL